MSILSICITRESVLHRTTAPIDSFDSKLHGLVVDMIETIHTTPGADLAASQVGVDSQVFAWRHGGTGSFDTRYRDVFQLDGGLARGFNTVLHGIVVNPTLDLVQDTEGTGAILPEEPDITLKSEGCLSVLGYEYPLRHAPGMILRGCNVDGNVIEVRTCGWPAHIFQHGYDHLQGTLYVDRLAQPYAAQA